MGLGSFGILAGPPFNDRMNNLWPRWRQVVSGRRGRQGCVERRSVSI